jgi:type IV secretion system protein VirB4
MAHTLLEQTAVNIFFPAPKPDRDSYRRGFHLSDVEIEWLATTPKEARQFLIKKAHDSVVVRLDLSHMLDIVHVLSGNPDTARECERLRAAYGDAPGNWLKYFCGWEKEPSR